MTLVMRSREATFDVDALFKPADKIRDIAQQIAIKEGLEEDWSNDGVKGFVDISRMSTVPVRQYSNLDLTSRVDYFAQAVFFAYLKKKGLMS